MKRPDDLSLTVIGTVRSTLLARADAPRQPDEGAPAAELRLDEPFRDALHGLNVGDRIVVVTWLHEADRTVHVTRPRDDPARHPVGVFATRSPDRPNPIGLHETVVTGITTTGLTVDAIEAIDGTPIIDLKPVLGPPADR